MLKFLPIISYQAEVSSGNKLYSKAPWFFSESRNYSATPSLCLSEYDLVSPYEVDHNGDYVSHEITHPQRRKRALAQLGTESLHLRLKGFRHDFHMELKASSDLVAPGFMVQTLGKGGTKSVHTFPPEDFCFYQGSLRSHKNSSVALSTCKGLVSTAWVLGVWEGRECGFLWEIVAGSAVMAGHIPRSVKAEGNCQVILSRVCHAASFGTFGSGPRAQTSVVLQECGKGSVKIVLRAHGQVWWWELPRGRFHRNLLLTYCRDVFIPGRTIVWNWLAGGIIWSEAWKHFASAVLLKIACLQIRAFFPNVVMNPWPSSPSLTGPMILWYLPRFLSIWCQHRASLECFQWPPLLGPYAEEPLAPLRRCLDPSDCPNPKS